MEVTYNNIKDLPIDEKDKKLLESLLIDLQELNQILDDKGESYRKLFIDFQEYHDVYSPERVDPCPDYYGYYRLRFIENPYETCNSAMTLDLLDESLCTLVNFMEFTV